MPSRRYIHIVMSRDIVFGAYTNPELAYAHARTITGTDVVTCDLFTTLPDSVKDDLHIDEYSEAEDTPVISISFDDILPKDEK